MGKRQKPLQRRCRSSLTLATMAQSQRVCVSGSGPLPERSRADRRFPRFNQVDPELGAR
jgi:hypothetical protein